MLSYNLARETLEKLHTQLNACANWISARHALFTSIAQQKMGLFHNQPLFKDKSTFRSQINATPKNIGLLINEDKPVNLRGNSSEILVRYAYKDMKTSYNEPVMGLKGHGNQMLRLYDRPEAKLAKLFLIWHQKGGEAFTQEGLEFFKEQARPQHFCYTPFLFLPDWRAKAYDTRRCCSLSCNKKQQMFTSRAIVDHDILLDEFGREFTAYAVNVLGYNIIKTKSTSALVQGN